MINLPDEEENFNTWSDEELCNLDERIDFLLDTFDEQAEYYQETVRQSAVLFFQGMLAGGRDANIKAAIKMAVDMADALQEHFSPEENEPTEDDVIQ